MGASEEIIRSPQSTDAVMADPFTAIIFLFHDHNREVDLMIKALSTPAYFIGAMGSPDTHDRRCAGLRHRGVSALYIQRIIGPVGVIHGARDGDRLAVSILAQLVAASDNVSHSTGKNAPVLQHS
ncbi:XdhC family protein [Sphingobium yanoikuyae]|uniref:XdhC family protein n=1 Tax=Sphingobium yanoikuyae TaxID=13690 RepID=UPI002FDB755A